MDTKTKEKASQKKSAAENIQENVRSIADVWGFFFNYFECLNTKFRSNIVLKAWNKGATFMTQVNISGIDFSIPVLLKKDGIDEVDLNLGPLSREWTSEQEKNVSSVIFYILIDAKNDLSTTDAITHKAAEKCRLTSHNFLCKVLYRPYQGSRCEQGVK